jgi:hypothetical protein
MTHPEDPGPNQFPIEELPQVEETLSPEEAKGTQDGIIVVGGRIEARVTTRSTLGDGALRKPDP